ncbi:MAG TPA: hypothetical protein VFS94_05450 [Gemmatimonadales bacterium]|nr:hypothetical protein [Gemmatimonadales bacterium]
MIRPTMLLAALALLPQSDQSTAGANVPTAMAVGTRAQAALRLPAAVAELQAKGVPLSELNRALEAFRSHAVPATDAVTTLDIERGQAEPMKNFGAFVQQQLADGKRGTALAGAIREEHGRRKADRNQGRKRNNGEPL